MNTELSFKPVLKCIEKDINPELEIRNVIRHETGEENELKEKGDLKKLDELKELSKKIEKDLEVMKKQANEIEKKLKQKEAPPMFCFFLSLRAGAITIGVISLAIFSISLVGFGSTLVLPATSHKCEPVSSYHVNRVVTISSLDGLFFAAFLSVVLGLFTSSLLLFGIFLNHKSYLRACMVLKIFLLNWFLLFFLGFQVGLNVYYKYSDFKVFGFLTIFEAFALYSVYQFYKTMD